MSETCSVLGKVWKTISALISQQWPNMRSCFEPADRETHCWLSMIGTEWQRVVQSIWFEGEILLLLPRRSVLKVKILRRRQDPHNWSWTNGTKIEAVKCFWQSADPWYETLHLRDDSDSSSSWDRWVLKLREETSQGRSMSPSLLNLGFKLSNTQGGRGSAVFGQAKIYPKKIHQAHICLFTTNAMFLRVFATWTVDIKNEVHLYKYLIACSKV